MLLTERARYWGILLGVTILLLVWYLPGTVALRNLAIVLLLLLAAPSWKLVPWRVLRHVLWPLVLLSMWLIVQWQLWALQPDIVGKELRGEWFKAILTGLLGVQLASVWRNGRPVISPRLIFLVGLLVPMAFTAHSLWLFIIEGRWLAAEWLGTNRTSISFWTNIQLGLLMADTLAIMSGRQSVLRLSLWSRLAVFALLLLTTYVTVTRNGHIAALVLCLVGLVISVWQASHGWRRAVWLLIGFAMLGLFAWNLLRVDSRWLYFVETVPLAWDTQHHKAWLNPARYPLPMLSDGVNTVELSAYERLAWAKEGVLSVGRFPMGVGYDRNAFRRALHARFPSEPHLPGHSHSGMLDIAVGMGLPGLGLWLLWGGVMVAYGLRAYIRERQATGLMVAFVVSGFFVRSVLDSNVRDHMLEHFMFLSAFLLTSSVVARLKPSECHNEH